jgi:aromatic ring hydroxylase
MRSSKEYRESLRKMKRNVRMAGDLVDRDDELMMGAVNILSHTFDFAEKKEHQDLAIATSHITGEKINRFNHIHQSKEDLHKKQDMIRLICQQVGGCIQRCMGMDAFNALSVISYEADKMNKNNTEYYKNFLKFAERFQREDLVGCCAQTDVKGDRSKRPHQQADPDLYLRVVEKKSDGIVVRGAKCSITVSAQAEEIFVVPTRFLTPEEGDWAVAFALPGDWEGMTHIVRASAPRSRKHLKLGFEQGMSDSFIVFDDVFVPWERVFLCGEHMLGGMLALLFALYHRHSYTGCKPAVCELFMGTVALTAEYLGIAKAKHIRDKLADMIMTIELVYAAGYTASDLGSTEMAGQKVGPGTYIPDPIYSNVGRCLAGEKIFHELEIIADVAGGLPSTLPYEDDFFAPETRDALHKYIMRNPDIKAENQHRLYRYISDLLCSSFGGASAVGLLHGGGSPIMEKIAITGQYDIEARKEMIKRLAGIED